MTYFLGNLVDIHIRENNGWVVSTPLWKLVLYTQLMTDVGKKTYNSRVTLFSVLLALCITNLPVVVEPVKLILSIPGWLVSHGPRLSSPLRDWTTPGGKNS